MKIGFWGIGNMGGAIMRGYSKSISDQADVKLFAFDLDEAKLEKATDELKVTACKTLDELADSSDILIIALKPNLFDKVLPDLVPLIDKNQIIVSVAAGISLRYMASVLGEENKLIRVMPNTPAMINEGMSALTRNDHVTDEDLDKVLSVFKSVGRAEEVPEKLMDAVTGVSGSGPAYVYMFIDALAKGAAEAGFDKQTAVEFAAQTTLGAAKMVLETKEDPDTLCEKVCSPNGTTIEAVKVLKANGFEDDIKSGMNASIKRSKEITK